MYMQSALSTASKGIPLLYFALLYKKRDRIAPTAEGAQRDENDTSIARLRFLCDSYKPRCMYFEACPVAT